MNTTSFHIPVQVGTPNETKIAVDLHLPRHVPSGGVPTILRATRYARDIQLLGIARLFYRLPQKRIVDFFVKHGYAWVDVDARGSGASFGHKIGPADPLEVQDYREIIHWISEQSWSNDKIGTTGISYGGTTAEMMLANDPVMVDGKPVVLAVAPRFSYFDAGLDIARPGGIHLQSFTREWSKINAALDRNDIDATLDKWYKKAMVVGIKPVDKDKDGKLLKAATKEHEKNWDPYRSAQRQRYPYGPWPAEPTLTSIDFSAMGHIPKIRSWGAAFYSYGGWYDGAYARAVINRWLTLSKASKTPHKMVLGPWNHSGNYFISPFRKTNKSNFNHSQELLRFFDLHLKGLPNTKISDEDPIWYYTMGAEKWESTDQWPPYDDEDTYFFNKGGELKKEKPITEANDHHQVDLGAGTGTTTRWETLVGRSDVDYGDRRNAKGRLLKYTSDPLNCAHEVTGQPVVTLHVKSSDSEGHFFVYLEDVAPDGRVTYVTEGMLDVIHRSEDDEPTPYERLGPNHSFKEEFAEKMIPKKIETLAFDLLPISYLFKEGHKIRVSIAGADVDHFEKVNCFPVVWQMYSGGENASKIVLPIRPIKGEGR